MYSSSSAISAVDLGGRALPVLLREREQREVSTPASTRALDDLAHGLHARAVAERARHVALARPAAVAVHDDRDVARHRAVHADPRQQLGRGLIATGRPLRLP